MSKLVKGKMTAILELFRHFWSMDSSIRTFSIKYHLTILKVSSWTSGTLQEFTRCTTGCVWHGWPFYLDVCEVHRRMSDPGSRLFLPVMAPWADFPPFSCCNCSFPGKACSRRSSSSRQPPWCGSSRSSFLVSTICHWAGAYGSQEIKSKQAEDSSDPSKVVLFSIVPCPCLLLSTVLASCLQRFRIQSSFLGKVPTHCHPPLIQQCFPVSSIWTWNCSFSFRGPL